MGKMAQMTGLKKEVCLKIRWNI